MKTLEESIAAAMDAQQDKAIIPFLPYILQDFWELGTPPEIVINLIQRHCKKDSVLNVLDLGSGKGATSVKLAAALKCNCLGIDGIPEFVETSKEKAREYGVETLCRFELGDVRKKIEELDKFDAIILGATGPIFDDYFTALSTLSKHLTDEGVIIIEEGYIDDASAFQHPYYLSRAELLKQFSRAGMEVVAESMKKYSEYTDIAKEMKNLAARCEELKEKYPEKASLFENYVQNQASEYDALENEMMCSIMVVRRVKSSKQWYESLFENYGKKYDSENFTQGTVGECDFIEKEINFDKSLKILDVGCGTGRHAIELTKRGYCVTGIDLSESQLKRAREKAAESNLSIDFQRQDARNLSFNGEFDVAIMLCEGGFSLMETDEMNFEILRNVTKSLKPHAKFIFTTLNGLFPLYNSVDEFYASTVEEGNSVCKNSTFDLMTFRDHNIVEFEDDSGNKKTLECNERYYVPCEITWLLKSLGYKTIDIFGARLGAFSREHKLTTKDFEMLVIAET